jgi:thiol-disulfide isomerase/thioredoxin
VVVLAAAVAAASCAPAPAGCQPAAPAANLDFTLKDTDGADVQLASYKGKVLFLNFWATWCVPCKVEIPVLVELQERYGKDGFAILGIVVLDDFKNAKPYAEKAKINYPVLDGTNRKDLEEAFNPPVLPSSFVIRRDGTICSEHHGIQPPKDGESLTDAIRRKLEPEIKALL